MKNSIINKNLKQCCSCSACLAVCPKNAISYNEDSLGFLYPNVDESLCIDCGLCSSVCQINESIKDTFIPMEVYAVRHIDIRELETSRSGGAFIAFSDEVLARNGYVYGAAWKDPYSVYHKVAKDKKTRNQFKNSKYIQSTIPEGLFREIGNILSNSDLLVLFSGTPCQVWGLRRFLRKKRIATDNLLLIDIVCQGVASPRIWRDYVQYLENRLKLKSLRSNLRDKDKGWNTHFESIEFEGNKKVYSKIFTNLYYSNVMLRDCCYSCSFCTKSRVGDITLADFWGWEKVAPDFNQDNKGCSLVFINNEKGERFLSYCKDKLNLILCNINEISQDNLTKPTPQSELRNSFITDVCTKSFKYILNKYCDQDIKSRLKNRIIVILKRILLR